jgi:hypothetical protein
LVKTWAAARCLETAGNGIVRYFTGSISPGRPSEDLSRVTSFLNGNGNRPGQGNDHRTMQAVGIGFFFLV